MAEPLNRHSRAITQGPDRAPSRAMFKAVGLTDEDLDRPLVGIANTWIEVMPCNFHLRRLSAKVKEGVRAAGGVAHRVQHRGGLRRRLHGHRGDEGVAHQPGGHRRLHRAGDPRAPVRRGGGAVRLRQDHPGHGHGAGAAGPAVADALRRLHHARAVPGARRDHPGRVRGRGRPRGQEDDRRRVAGPRKQRLPRPRCVRRTVHRQHHGHGIRDPGHLAHRQRQRSGHGRHARTTSPTASARWSWSSCART